MALQIWLPLNGNLNNQGLSDLKFSVYESSTTSNGSGKIGSCYTNNSNTSGGVISDKKINLGTKHSMFCWVKMTDFFANSSLTGVLGQHRHQSCQGMGITMKYITSTTGYLSVNTGNGNGGRTYNTYCGSTVLNAGTWYHVGYTYNNGVIKLYVNGKLDGTHTYISSIIEDYVQLFSWSFKNSSVTNEIHPNYKLKGFLNDVRIYDHCLSDKEVSEISKGLVLHYKLSENYQTLDNCYSYPTFNTSSASGGWSHWAPSNNTGKYSQNTDRTYIYRDSQTYSHYFEHSSGDNYYICYQSPAFEGGYRSAQAIIKMPNGEDPRGHIAFSHNANVGTNPPMTFTQLENGFWLMKHEGFQQDGSNDLVSIYITHNKGVYVSEAYLENNKQVCSDIFSLHDGKIVDCSGYGRDGVLYGSVTSSADTARYDGSVVLDGGNTAIKIGNLSSLIHDGIFTFNCWFNKQDFSSKGWETIFGGPSGFEFQSKRSTTNSPSLVAYSWGQSGSGGQVYDLNKWNMVTMVRTSSNCKFYLNGSLYYTGSAGSIPSGDYFLGSWKIYSSQNYKGMFSDARIYATTLSENDIRELYSLGTSIDNNGNLMCYMANEGVDNLRRELGPHISLNSPNVVFNNDGSYTISGHTWPTTDYIQISPTSSTKYYYDIEFSNVEGNHLYIGFEKYDANKQSGSNSECQYQVAQTAAANHKRVKGIIDLSTANGHTAAFTKLRILNNWDNVNNNTYKGTIHHISLKESIRLNKVDITREGVLDCDNFIESSSASIDNVGNVICNRLIEI